MTTQLNAVAAPSNISGADISSEQMSELGGLEGDKGKSWTAFAGGILQWAKHKLFFRLFFGIQRS